MVPGMRKCRITRQSGCFLIEVVTYSRPRKCTSEIGGWFEQVECRQAESFRIELDLDAERDKGYVPADMLILDD